MAAPASPDPAEERAPHKRPKPDESSQQDEQTHQQHGSSRPGYPPQQIPPHHRYPPPPHYGGPPPQAGPNSGYSNMWGSQYNGPHPPPPSVYPMYSQRGPPLHPGDRPPSDYYRNGVPPPPPPPSMPRSSQSSVAASSQTKPEGIVDDRPLPPQPYPGWSPHAPQWHGSSYGPPPPHSYQGPSGGSSQYSPHHGPRHTGPPPQPPASGPMHSPAGPLPPPNAGWGNSSSSRSPPRGGRMRQEAPYGSRHELDMSYMTSRPAGGMMDDEMEGSSTGGSAKDKGRGSYKCGRCGVPKKGHVCPYQPKVKRRPDEPMPVTRNAAIQVEMDEFMTLRRLNLKIQGLPESYAGEPFASYDSCMVVGEPAQHAATPLHQDSMPTTSVGHLQTMPPHLSPDNMAMMGLSAQPPHAMATAPMSMDNELLDPTLDADSSSPLPPDLPRSSPSPPLLSKDVAVGNDDPIVAEDDAPLAMDDEKKE